MNEMEIHITPWWDKKNSFLIPLSLFLFVFKSIFDSNNAVNFQIRWQINLTFNEPILPVKMYLFQEFDIFCSVEEQILISCHGTIFRNGLSSFYLAAAETFNSSRLNIWRRSYLQQVKPTVTPPHILKILSF